MECYVLVQNPASANFFKMKFGKKNKRKEELTALFKLRNEYRGNLKYTPSYYPVDLKCSCDGPFWTILLWCCRRNQFPED